MKQRAMITNSVNEVQEFVFDILEDYVVLLKSTRPKLTPDDPAQATRIEIPCTFMGKPVTEIGHGCFAFRKDVNEIIVPDSVEKIGKYAFAFMRSLRTIVLPKGLKEISVGMFSGTYLPEGFAIPEGVEVIREYAFRDAGYLELVIPDSVKTIERGAFYDLAPIPVTKLPKDRSWFMPWPFGESVIVDSESGTITDIRSAHKGSCELHAVTSVSGSRMVFYPCDYLDGRARFEDETNRERLEMGLKMIRESEWELKEAREAYDFWKDAIRKGLTS